MYYNSGLLKEYGPYANLGTGQVHGLATTWYENGQMESRQPFRQGKRDGRLELYYADGRLKRETDYVAGAELPGRCIDAADRAAPYFPYEQLPLYSGGQERLAKEINKAMRWPQEVSTVAGLGHRTVYVTFWVAKEGSIRQPQVAVSSQLPSSDRALLATVQKLTRRFTPARRDGLVVESKYYLPVEFGGVAYLGWTTKN
ncbi:MAG: TonB family protein [Hymenobacter sp.]|nr:MAG: TonB family protein [Hymenobacter sp.]